MKRKTFLRKRSWLNPIDSPDTGAISVRVAYEYNGVDAELEIRDCNRLIRIDFGFFDLKAAEQRAKKLDILINHLQEMRDSLGQAYNFMVEKEDP